MAPIVGKPAILWTLETARKVSGIDGVYVATDDARIQEVVQSAGGNVIMTSESCKNGTERVAEAATQLSLQLRDIVINFQGDAPLTPPWFVEQIVKEMRSSPDAAMVTPVLRCDSESYERFREDRRNGRVGATTAIFDNDRNAIYFSKEVTPYLGNVSMLTTTPVFHHVGIYGYRVSALREYSNWTPGPLELAEQLEQLRFIENGRRVRVTEVDAQGVEFWELNNPEDLELIVRMIERNRLIPPIAHVG